MLDTIDKTIIAILEDEGRVSFASLAEKVGLSKTPCWNRVRELEAKGVISGYHTQVEPEALGLHIRALVNVVVDFETYEEFEAAILAHDAVRACYAVTGEYDYVLEVLAGDMAAFDTLLRDGLSRLPGVQRFNTSIATRMIKTASSYSRMTEARA